MANNEVDYSTIRIKNDVRNVLDSLKIEKESYSVVISNLMEENKRLEEYVEFLKEDRLKLYELALGSENSVALVSNIHKVSYFIGLVINDISSTDEEKLKVLKTYLQDILENNPADVVTTIKNLKEILEPDVPEVLVAFEGFVSENY